MCNVREKNVNYIKGLKHRLGEGVGVVLTGEIESVHLFVVPPLVKRARRLIVLEPSEDRAVNNDLVILQFSADYTERVVHLMMVELNLG